MITSEAVSGLVPLWLRSYFAALEDDGGLWDGSLLCLLTGVPSVAVVLIASLLVGIAFRRVIIRNDQDQVANARGLNAARLGLPSANHATGACSGGQKALQLQILEGKARTILERLEILERQIKERSKYSEHRRKRVHSISQEASCTSAPSKLSNQQGFLFPVDFSNPLEFWEVEDMDYPGRQHSQ
nr:PREDICTED: uncharacterized protein LOC106702651 [Latimeria chalumnae]XP_014340973.1 PREDICTED: uncharacterized protein LOC106702651 [Latimeria chalumnae]|eukprot:XP_014340972.1 PREDICTED: uncharacterized protein LOC106702651 [Latimeria chalumnae]